MPSPPPPGSPVSAKDEPVSSSRSVTVRTCRRGSSSSCAPGRAPSRSQSPSAASFARAASSSRASASAAEPPPIRCPASVTSTPGARGAASRASTASIACSATVRPKRASHACGIASEFSIVPVAAPSAMRAPTGFESLSTIVSEPSSSLSSSTATSTVLSVSPAAKTSVPLAAV